MSYFETPVPYFPALFHYAFALINIKRRVIWPFDGFCFSQYLGLPRTNTRLTLGWLLPLSLVYLDRDVN